MALSFSRRHVLAGGAALSAATALPRGARAADWRPNQSVRLIVPAAPGGTTDILGRLLARYLQSAWGQPAIVENKSGGGGTIGTQDFLRQKPDGHTILVGNPGPNAIAYTVYRKITYKPEEILPVSNMIRIPNIVTAHPSAGIKSIGELIAFLRENPDKLSYATSGAGQSPHLSGAWFLQLTGLKMAHIPFRGAGPALQAVLGGEVPILFDNLFPSFPQVKGGNLVPLAVTTTERTKIAPELPTMRESAPELAPYDISSWFGIFLHRDAPPEAVASLNKEIGVFLQDQDTQKRIAEIGAVADHTTPEQYATFIQNEIEKFAGIIREENLVMDVN